MIKRFLLNLLYKLLVYLVDHNDDDVRDEYALSWLTSSYTDPGFKNWLTSKYAHYTKYLAGAYRGDDEYKRVMTKLITLRQIEMEAKNANQKLEDLKIKK